MRSFLPIAAACGCLATGALATPGQAGFPVAGDSRTSRAELRFDAGKETAAILELQWLHPDLPAEGESWRHGSRTQGRFRRDRAGITQTWFALRDPRVGVLHLRADKPGALGFRIVLRGGEAQVSERRRITVTAPLPDGRVRAARAWVFPMESEVTPEERTIRVEGEGEALVLVTTAEAEEAGLEVALKAPLVPLGFGDDEMPDLSQVWRRLDERQQLERKTPP